MPALGQQQTFDITSYTMPRGWTRQSTDGALQFSKEDAAKGTYCLIMLFKALPGGADARKNFDASWKTVVRETITVKGEPQMQAPVKENGWEAVTGAAPFESEGKQGIVMLVTTTGFGKMVNILVLTNTDVYEKEMSAFLESVSFKKPAADLTPPDPKKKEPVIVQENGAKKDGFAFNTTNFDDGWTSTVQEDWVQVSKGNIKVLLHYPKQGTIFPADPEPLTVAAWNILVAPRYRNLRNFRTAYINTYNRPYLGFGYATEAATGKEVYVVLFRQSMPTWYEFITPDKNTFISQFKFDPETIRWDSESDLLKPLEAMGNYNKFAIAASDFKGKWTSDFSGVQQLYNVYTGNYAGMQVNQSNEEFVFGAGNSYDWKFLAVNGMVGNMNYNQAKSSGKFTVLNNWQIRFSKIESRAKTCNAFWSCIKGARILNLLDADYPGSGIYTRYGQAR